MENRRESIHVLVLAEEHAIVEGSVARGACVSVHTGVVATHVSVHARRGRKLASVALGEAARKRHGVRVLVHGRYVLLEV